MMKGAFRWKHDSASTRFWSYVALRGPGECWVWLGKRGGSTEPEKYGVFSVGGKEWRAHRYALYLSGIDVPPGMEVDHLCRRRACVNPAHLEVVTHKVNALRGFGIPAQRARWKTCMRGHALKLSNRGNRVCLTCRAANLRKHRAARSMVVST